MGFSSLEIDRDLAQQNKFGLRRASGIFPDGTPFDLGDTSPVPNPWMCRRGRNGALSI